MGNNIVMATLVDALNLTFLVAMFCLLIAFPIVGSIVRYYDGPCGSYTGPYPATAKDGVCVYEPVGK
jgi:hypothetical protein